MDESPKLVLRKLANKGHLRVALFFVFVSVYLFCGYRCVSTYIDYGPENYFATVANFFRILVDNDSVAWDISIMMRKAKNRKKESTIGNRSINRRAWAIRRLTASANDVPLSHVHFGSCIKVAQGRKKEPTDVFGNTFSGRFAEINKALLSWECPVVIDYELVAKMSGTSVQLVKGQMGWLRKKGIVRDCHGWESIKLDKRPYHSEPKEVIVL